MALGTRVQQVLSKKVISANCLLAGNTEWIEAKPDVEY